MKPLSKAILYIPGLLSLLLLFPLLYYKLLRMREYRKHYTIEVVWFKPDLYEPYVRAHNAPPARNYTTINLTGDEQKDNTKIDYARLLVDDMVSQFDTLNGVRIHFTDTIKLQAFIDVLEVCNNKNDTLAYALYDNHVLIFNRIIKADKNATTRFTLINCLRTIVLYSPKERQTFASLLQYDFDKKLWPVYLLFIVLLTMSFKRIHSGGVRKQ